MTTPEVPILRSLLFVPGNRPNMLEKARAVSADALVPDLEDSVPFAEKERARAMVAEALLALAQRGQKIIPRINDLSTGLAYHDLAALVGPHIYAVNVGKVDTPRDVLTLSEILETLERPAGLPVGQIKLLPFIESARAVINAYAIATASPRVVALAFGAEDFTNDMGIQRTEEGAEVAYPRAAVAVAARAAGVLAVDTPYVNFQDAEGLKRDVQTGLRLGYKGKFAIHPSQVATINAIFSPSKEEVKYARRVAQAYEEAEAQGRAATSLDGKMIDVPIVKRARKLLAWADVIAKHDEKLRSP